MKTSKVSGFYSSVILNSTETLEKGDVIAMKFYSSVILNSTETPRLSIMRAI